MHEGTPSRTAAWVAAARGMGRLLPDSVRIADDPYGMAFAYPRLGNWMERHPQLARGLVSVPGVAAWIAYMQIRTRLLDDAIRAFILGGGSQVVLLGAGYDCRALRMPELKGVIVCEVDHPSTQNHKRAVLERIKAVSPARYVCWDFEKRALHELPDALVGVCLDPGKPTITLWEGVTMYLTEPAIDASLRAIAAWSAPGSRLAMTYIARTPKKSLPMRTIAALASFIGEPWRWGWIPEELPAYLSGRGFTLLHDIPTSHAARQLLPARLAATVTHAGRRVVIAAR